MSKLGVNIKPAKNLYAPLAYLPQCSGSDTCVGVKETSFVTTVFPGIFSEAFGNANRSIARIKISVVNNGRECLIERVIPSSL